MTATPGEKDIGVIEKKTVADVMKDTETVVTKERVEDPEKKEFGTQECLGMILTYLTVECF